MREIKFRVWDKVDSRLIAHEQDFIPLKVCSIGVLRLHPFSDSELWEMLPLERFVLMQYTGLKGKNGTEIYEGDVLESSKTGYRYQVKYDDRRACFRATFKLIELATNNWYKSSKVGNVHQNPELLS